MVKPEHRPPILFYPQRNEKLWTRFYSVVKSHKPKQERVMEIKVVCDCGQKYKFDVEPAGGRMPVNVACPSCGADGTHSANSFITQNSTIQSPPIAPPISPIVPAIAPAPAGGLRISQPAP